MIRWRRLGLALLIGCVWAAAVIQIGTSGFFPVGEHGADIAMYWFAVVVMVPAILGIAVLILAAIVGLVDWIRGIEG